MIDLLSGDDEGFAALLDKIGRDRGFGCSSYKERCLRRRIAVRMRATGVHTYAAYADLLDVRHDEYDRLLDALTINVTKLFRNWETYSALSDRIIPTIWQRAEPQLRVWSAGCSSGEEPYSLSILFHRHAASLGQAEHAGRVEVLGTDIDRRSLESAERGEYAEPAFADTPADLRAAYFSPEMPHRVESAAKRLVRFDRLDLLCDDFPRQQHLIVCRNVIIYFDRESQERLFMRFHEALAPGGFLVLGKVESLFGPVRDRFVTVEPRERIFRKAD